MKHLFFLSTLILIAVLNFQCRKELSYIGEPDVEIIAPAPITAHIQGNVYNEIGQPASGVSIKVGNKTATTNAQGYFRIQQASLDKKTSLVTAEKGGYFKAYRTFSATSGTNNVAIKLIKKAVSGTINSTSGGDVTLSNGFKVALPANGVVNAATNAPYSGTINVYAAFIDPTASDIDQTVPGSFMANDRNGRRVILSSYGMMAVELESTSGEKLQIKQGSKATLTSPIPASLQSSAPATIALWYVDEQNGLWKEEGSANKNGSSYIGDVTHFSFWNCDISVPAITLTLTLHNANGLPIVHGKVKITRPNPNPVTTHGWTDTLGQVSGLVPANQNLILTVLDQCNNPVYTQNIGPFSQNTNLGVITIINNTASIITVTGKILGCNNNPLPYGIAIIAHNNMTWYATSDANGDFNKVIVTCAGGPSPYTITAIDTAAQQHSATITGTLTAPITNAGNIAACGNIYDEYIQYTINTTNYLILSQDSLGGYTITGFPSTTKIAGSSEQFFFTFHHPANTAGTYQAATLRVGGQTYSNLPVNITITHFPQSPGNYYEGTFSGHYATTTGVSNINGIFKVKRSF